MSKRKVTYRNYHADNLQKQKEETNKYRHSYLVALKLLLPSPHRTNCSSNWKHPLISCILPLKETASFRVVIGSHLRIIENGNNIIHRETVQTISIPKSCCVLFYHNRTIHGGGASMLGEPKMTRVFLVYGPPSMYEGIQNDNYGKRAETLPSRREHKVNESFILHFSLLLQKWNKIQPAAKAYFDFVGTTRQEDGYALRLCSEWQMAVCASLHCCYMSFQLMWPILAPEKESPFLSTHLFTSDVFSKLERRKLSVVDSLFAVSEVLVTPPTKER